MTGEFTQAAAFKAAMVAAAHTLWDAGDTAVDIVNGHPGITQVDDIVSFADVSAEQVPGPMGSRRTRDETLTLEVIFSIYRAGGRDMEQVTFDRAYELLGDLERHVRVTDTTLGGLVRHCFLVGHASEGSTEPAIVAKGRLTTMVARFEAVARITTTA